MNAEELLAHNSFLVSVARRLVLDEQSAHDVAQQTYVAALENPPGEHKPLAPWLTTVARNFARMTFRSERRRRERERAVSLPEGIPSSADIVAQEEIRSKVVDAVLALDEPFRDVIVLRFYQGLPHRDAARRLGIPLETMRSRLKRAMALLAKRLDSMHDGERKNWLAAIGPIAGLKGAAPTASATAAGGAAGTASIWAALGALSLKFKIGAAALVLLGTALWFAGPTEPDGVEVDYAFAPIAEADTRGGENEDAALADPDVEPGRVPLEPRPEGTGAPAAAPGETRALLAGRFVDADGAPVAGVAVADPVDGARVRSGSDGRFEFSFALRSSKRSDRKMLAITRSGFASRETEVVVRADETVHLGDVVLEPGGALSGRVVDPLGNPVTGAKVTCSLNDLLPDDDGQRRKNGPMRRHCFIDEAPPTAADGTFCYSGAPVGWVRLWAHAEGMLYTYTRPVEVRARQETRGLELVLEPMGREELIAGVVLDPDGEPIPYAQVFCYHRGFFGGGSGSFMTDKKGRFSRELKRKTAHTFEASDSEQRFCPVRARKVAPGTLDLVLQLKPLSTFTVVARAGKMASLEKAVVDVTYRDEFPETYSYEIVPRVSGGTFIFDVPVPAAEFTIKIDAARFQSADAGPFSPDSIPEPVEIARVAAPGIDGAVASGSGPMAGAWLWLYKEAGPNREVRASGFACRVNPGPTGATMTDEQGNFHLDLRESGTFFLRVQADGFAAAEAGPLEIDHRSGLDGVRVELDQGGSLEGRIWTADGKSPAGVVVAISRGDGFPRSVRANADGVYRFDRLTPGRYQVERRDEEITSHSHSVRSARKPAVLEWVCVVESGKTTYHDLDLGGGVECTLEGRLSLNGAVPAGWKACLVPEQDGNVAGHGVCLDGNGAFRLTSQKPGVRRLCLTGRFQDGPEIELSDKIALHPGANEWRQDIALGRLVIEGAIPAPNYFDFYGYKWDGPDDFEIVVILRMPKDGEPFACFAPVGKGSIVRVRKERDSKEEFLEEVVAGIEVKADEVTRVKLE